jgi:hypothetical protein
MGLRLSIKRWIENHWSMKECSIALEASSTVRQGVEGAAQSLFRMLDSVKPNIADMQRHLKIYKTFHGIRSQTLARKEAWNNISMEQDALKKKRASKDGDLRSLLKAFQSLEMYAVNVCSRIYLSIKSNHVYIMSYIQVALRALTGYTFSSMLEAQYHETLKSLTSWCKVTHIGIQGNET